MKSSMSLIVLGLLIVGCGSKSSSSSSASKISEPPVVKITAENQKNLFPFAVGNRWTYVAETSGQVAGRPRQTGSFEMEYRVDKVVEANGLTRATLGVYQNGVKKDEQEWGSNGKGIYQISSRKDHVVYQPMQPVLRFPIKDQDEFTWDGRGLTPVGKSGKMTYAYKQDGMQTADTAMGPMNCVYMQSAGSFKNDDGLVGQIAVNSWFAPGVGLARYRQGVILKQGESIITLRLKSYTVKK